jgi:hypothetical protein
MAEKGSPGERGLSPLSISLPLSNKRCQAHETINLFERGIKGVSIKNQLDENGTLKPDTSYYHFGACIFKGR